MRAGLLSQPEVIETVNERFVSTTISLADLMELAKADDVLANVVAFNFTNPVTVMFLSEKGRFISKLTVLDELNDVHPDTTFRPGQRQNASPDRNTQAFLRHVNQYFGKSP